MKIAREGRSTAHTQPCKISKAQASRDCAGRRHSTTVGEETN